MTVEFEYLQYNSVIDLVLQTLLGFGMVIVLLEQVLTDAKNETVYAAEFFRCFDSHQAEIETLFGQLRIEVALFVHGFDAFANFAFGKLAHAGAKHLFVF